MRNFRNRSFLLVGTLGIGVAVGLIVADWHLITESPNVDSVSRLTLYSGIAVFCWRTMFWCRITVTPRCLVVKNPLRTHAIPWPAIQGFRAEDRVVVELNDGGEIRCWAVQRTNLVAMFKWRSHVDNVVADLEKIRAAKLK